MVGSGDITIFGNIENKGGTVIIENGATITSDVLVDGSTSNNSLTITDAFIGGSVITKDGTSTILVIIRDSTITGSIEIGNSSDVTITGNDVSNGDIKDISGNSAPCIVANNNAKTTFLCPFS